MTNQELKEKALHFAKRFGGSKESFATGDAIDSVVVYFEGDKGTKVKVVLDRNTGGFLGATGTPIKSN